MKTKLRSELIFNSALQLALSKIADECLAKGVKYTLLETDLLAKHQFLYHEVSANAYGL